MKDPMQRLGEQVDTTVTPDEAKRDPKEFVGVDQFMQPFEPPTKVEIKQASIQDNSHFKQAPGQKFADGVTKIASRQESATIKKLRQAFGIAGVPLDHFDYGGFKWSFRVPGKTDITWAVVTIGCLYPDILPGVIDRDENEDLSSEDVFRENALRNVLMSEELKTALMCISIAAIDDIPVHEHFGLEVDTRKVIDPMRPGREVRQQAALFLHTVLADESSSVLLAALEGFYSESIEPKLKEADRVSDPLGEKTTYENTSTSTTQTSPDVTDSPG